MKKIFLSLSTTLFLLTTFSSASYADHDNRYFTKENVGKVMGVGLGALIGSKIGDGRGNDLAIAAGAVGGYVLGGKVGRDWKSKHQTHKSYTTHQTSRRASHQAAWPPIKKMPHLRNIDETYTASVRSNVRGGPSTNYVIVDNLYRGEAVRVLGKVINKDWYLVAQRGIIVGFVHSALLDPVNYYSLNH